MGIRTNRHGKKSDKGTQSPLLKIFSEIKTREMNDPEHRNLLPNNEKKKKLHHSSRTRYRRSNDSSSSEMKRGSYKDLDFDPRYTADQNLNDDPNEVSNWWLTGGDDPATYNIDTVVQKAAEATEGVKKSSHDDTFSVSCALRRIAGSEYGCIACLIVIFSVSIIVSCCLVYHNVPTTTLAPKNITIAPTVKIHNLTGYDNEDSMQMINTNRKLSPVVFGKSHYDSIRSDPNELPGSSEIDFGPSLRELNVLGGSKTLSKPHFEFPSNLVTKRDSETDSDKIKEFYKKLVQTDSKIKFLKHIRNLNAFNKENRPLNRLKRSLKSYKCPKRFIDTQMDIDNYNHVKPKEQSQQTKSVLNPFVNERRWPASFVIEKKKVIVKYDSSYPRKLVPKCSHSQKESSTQQHEHQLKHPFYQNTQKLDELLDNFLNKNLPDIVSDPFGFDQLFKNNTKTKCKHTNLKTIDMDHLLLPKRKIFDRVKHVRVETEKNAKNKFKSLTSNLGSHRRNNTKNHEANKNKKNKKTKNEEILEMLGHPKPENSRKPQDPITTKAYEKKPYSQTDSHQKSVTTADTKSTFDIMSSISTTMRIPDEETTVDVSKASPAAYSFLAVNIPPNARRLLQVSEDDETVGYDDINEVLKDNMENQDDTDIKMDRRKRHDKWLPAKGSPIGHPAAMIARIHKSQQGMPVSYIKEVFYQKETKLKPPPIGVHNPNWKGPMPLYPDEVNSMLKGSFDLNSKTQSHKAKSKFEKHKMQDHSINRKPAKFSDIDYIEDYLDNKYDKLVQMAQAYSDYGVLEAKKDARKDKNKITDNIASPDNIEKDDIDAIVGKRNTEDGLLLFGFSENSKKTESDALLDITTEKSLVSRIMNKIVKISDKYDESVRTELPELNFPSDLNSWPTEESSSEATITPLSFPMKKTKMSKETKDIRPSGYYETNKGRVLLSILPPDNYDTIRDNLRDERLDTNVDDSQNYETSETAENIKSNIATSKQQNNIFNNFDKLNQLSKDMKMIDLKYNELPTTNKDENPLKKIKTHGSEVNVSIMNTPYGRPIIIAFSGTPASYNASGLGFLLENTSQPTKFENFTTESKRAIDNSALRPLTIKDLYEAFIYSKNHTKLDNNDIKLINNLNNSSHGNNTFNAAKFITQNKFELAKLSIVDMFAPGRNKRRFKHDIAVAKTTHEKSVNNIPLLSFVVTNKSPSTNNTKLVENTYLCKDANAYENLPKFRSGLESSEQDRETNRQANTIKFESNTKPNMTKKIGYRSRVLLGIKEDMVNKTGSEIDIEVSIENSSEKNVTNRAINTTSITTNAPKKDNDLKKKFKRDVDDSNLIAWNDIYDDDYGVQTENIDKDSSESDFFKRSGKWVQDKIRKFAENLKGHDSDVIVKKRSPRSIKNFGIFDKLKTFHIKHKKIPEKDEAKDIFQSLEFKMPEVCKRAAVAVKKTRSVVVNEEDAKNTISASMMQQLVKLVIDLVAYHIEKRSCKKLPPDLKGFLVWLTLPEEEINLKRKETKIPTLINTKEDSYEAYPSLGIEVASTEHISELDIRNEEPMQDYQIHADPEDIYPDYNQLITTHFETTEGTPEIVNIQDHYKNMYINTIKSIQELLDTYEELDDLDKNKMSGVKLYLQRQLHYLNKEIINSQLYDLLYQNHLPRQHIQRLHHQFQPRSRYKCINYFGRKHTRTTVNHTVSIPVTDRVNVKKKIDSQMEIPQHNNINKLSELRYSKRNLQDIYYKALADAKKYNMAIANSQKQKNNHYFTDYSSLNSKVTTRYYHRD